MDGFQQKDPALKKLLTYLVTYSIAPVLSECISNSWSASLPTSSNVISGRFL